MERFHTLSVVIPVYNEEKFISRLIKSVINAKVGRLTKEIIIIDDGSTDNTNDLIKKIINKLKKTKKLKFILLRNSKNQGKGAALKRGFLKSTGDIVLVQDADLEYNPKDYPLLLQPILNQDADVVYGSRFTSYHPRRVLYFWHFVANLCLTTLSNIFTNLNLTDIETGYKIFNGKIIRSLAPKLQSRRFGFEPEITAYLAKIPKIRIYEVGISYFGRTYNEGKKIGFWDGILALWEIIKYNLLTEG